jgi:hypothetical protein
MDRLCSGCAMGGNGVLFYGRLNEVCAGPIIACTGFLALGSETAYRPFLSERDRNWRVAPGGGCSAGYPHSLTAMVQNDR